MGRNIVLVCALAAVAANVRFASAVDTTWTFNGNGNWNTAANWNAGEPTNNTFNAIIDDGDSAVTVTLNVNRSIGNLSVGANDALSFADTFDLTVAGGSVVNNGVISLNATSASNTDLNFTAAVTTLSGSGKLQLGSASQNRVTNSFVTNELINSSTHSIEGGGQLGFNGMKVTNQGLIDANISAAAMVVDPSSSNAVNTGTMRASNGGVLRLQGGVFTNTGGFIRALNGSFVDLLGGGGASPATIVGGTLATEGTGLIRTVAVDGGVTLQDVTLAAGSNLQFGANLDGNVAGTFTNNGAVSQPSDGGTMQLNIAAPTTLSGNGVWTMVGTALSNSVIRNPGVPVVGFTNGPQHTIQGQGNIGNFSNLVMDNKGTILANVATATLMLSSGGSGSLANSGTLRATGGATLTVASGVASAGGQVVADDASTVSFATKAAAFDGTTFTTAGTGAVVFSPAADHTLDDVTINGLVRFLNDADVVLRDTATNNGTVEQNSTASQTVARLDGDVTLTGTGVWKMSNNANNQWRRLAAGPANPILTNAAGHTIQGAGLLGLNEIGVVNHGLINADQATQLLIDPSTANVVNQTTGVIRGSGTGGLLLDAGSIDNQGTIEALNGSKVTYGNTGVTANNVAGVLTGGTWRSVATGGGATVTLRGNNITQLAAGTTVELSGVGSVLQIQSGVNLFPLDSTLTTNNGTLRILNGRNFAMTAALANGGTVELGGVGLAGGTLNSGGNITNAASGVISGHGTISDTILNSGTVRAAGGTLSLAGRIDGQSGTVQVDPGATLDLSGAGGVSDADNLIHNGAGLNLGANNFLVGVDFQNANFGVGNAFNARANVTGAGQINANPGVTQSLGGSVTGGTTPTATMAFGNVHVGDVTTLNYQINNVGAGGPNLRGAIQTSGGGASLTDARLTGAGATAGNFGPIADGANSGNRAVTFNATTAGALAGQQIRIVNNFDNVAEQTLQFTGAAYRLAAPSAHTPEPVNLGIVHVGDVAQQTLTISNTAANDGFSERLNSSIGSPTGSATTNSGTITGLAPGSSNNTSLVVGVNTATAGAKTGTATISLTSSGTGTSGLADTTLSSQTVNVSAQVNNFAAANVVKSSGAGALTPTGPNQFSLNLGTTLQGLDDLTAVLGVTNSAAAPANALSGSFATAAPGFSLTGFNSFNNLAAGSTQGGLTVSLDSGVAGTFNGQITLSPVSTNPQPFSMNLPQVLINLTGRVVAAGDFQEDGDVDGADLGVWKAGYGVGATHLTGDADSDGDVDGRDFLVWQRGGSPNPALSGTTVVPEPAAALLLASAAFLSVIAQGRVRGSCR